MGQDYGIQEALKKLGIEDVNNGACTGTAWDETSGDIITSYSPVDGEKIATGAMVGGPQAVPVISTV